MRGRWLTSLLILFELVPSSLPGSPLVLLYPLFLFPPLILLCPLFLYPPLILLCPLSSSVLCFLQICLSVSCLCPLSSVFGPLFFLFTSLGHAFSPWFPS